MQRSAEFMRPSPGELVGAAAAPYMRRVPSPERQGRLEAENRVDKKLHIRHESAE